MADNNLKIFIEALLNKEKSKQNINNQVKNIAQNIDKVNIDLNIDKKQLENVNKMIRSLSTDLGMNLDVKNLDKFERVFDSATERYKTMLSFTDDMGKSFRLVVQELEDGTKYISKFGENFSKARKEAEKLEKDIKKINNAKKEYAFKLSELTKGGYLSQDEISRFLERIKNLNIDNIDKIKKHYEYLNKVKKALIAEEIAEEKRKSAVLKSLDAQRAEYIKDSYNKVSTYYKTQLKEQEEATRQNQKAIQSMTNNFRKQIEKKRADTYKETYSSLQSDYKSRFNSEKQAVKETQKVIEQKSKAVKKSLQEQEKLEESIEQKRKKALAQIKANAEAREQAHKKEIIAMRSKIGIMTRDIKTNQKNTQEIKKQTKAQEKQLTMFQQFKVALSRVPVWMGAMTVYYGSLRAFQTGLQDIIEIDSAITALRRVVDEGSESLKEFSFEANQIGTSLGKTTTDVIKATTEFAKLGYELNKAKSLAQESMLYSAVGDINVEEASQSIISTVKGFNIVIDEQGQNVRKVVDIFNEVGNNFAVTSAGIGDALQRSASALYSAGNTIEEAVAMVASANASVQDPKVVGTALKTISLRLRGVSEDGESLIGLIPKLEGLFQKFGLTLMKADGSFKSTYEILNDLSQVWDKMADLEQAEVLEAIAGKRQANVVSAMLNNWNDAIEAQKAGLNATGSAVKEFENQTESFEYKINQFKNAVTGFWQQMLNTDSLKSFIDFGTVFVQKITEWVDVLGLVPIAIGTVTTALLLFSNTGGKVTTGIIQMITNFKELRATSMVTATTMQVLGASFKGTAISALALKTALSVLGGVIAIGVTIAVQKLITYYTELKQKQEMIEKQNKSMMESWKANNDEIKNLISDYEKLSKISDKTAEQEQRYAEVQNRLNQLMPSFTKNVDEKGNAHLRNIEAIKDEIEYLNKLQDNYNKLTIEEFETKVEENFDKIDELKDKMEDLKGTIDYWKNPNLGMTPDDYRKVISGEHIEKIVIAERELINTERELQLLYDDNAQLILDKTKAYLELSNNTKNLTEDDLNYIQTQIQSNSQMDITKEKAIEIANEFTNLAEKIDAVRESSGDIFSVDEIETFSEEQVRALDSFMGRITDEGVEKWDRFVSIISDKFKPEQVQKIIDYILAHKDSIEGATNATQNYNQIFEDTLSIFQTATDKITKVQSALDEYNETGKFSIDTILGLAGEHKKLLAIMGDDQTVRQELMSIMDDERVKLQDNYAKMIMASTDFYNAKIKGNATLVNELNDKYGIDLNNYKSLAQAKLEVERKLIAELGKKWANFYNAQNEFTGKFIDGGRTIVNPQGEEMYVGLDPNSGARKEFLDYKRKLKEAEERLRDIALDSSDVDFSTIGKDGSKSGGGGSSASKQTKEYIDLTEAIINSINAKSELLQKDQELIRTKFDFAERQNDYNEKIKLANQLLEKQKQTTSSLLEANKQIHAEADKIRDANPQFDTSKWVDANGEKTVAFLKEYDKASENVKEQMDRVFEALSKLGLAWQENDKNMRENNLSIEETKELLSQIEYDRITEQVDNYNRSIDDLNDKLTISEKKMSLYNEGSKEYRNEMKNQVDLIKQLQVETSKQINYLNEQLSLEELSIEHKRELKEQIEDLTIAQYEYAIQLQNTAQNIRNEISKNLQKLADQHKKVLTEQKETIVNELRDLIDTEESFNLDDFMGDFNSILLELDKIDGTVSNVIEHTHSTTELRKKIGEYKEDIVEIKTVLDGFKDMDFSNLSKEEMESAIRSEISYANELQEKIEAINDLMRERQELYEQERAYLEQQLALTKETQDLIIEGYQQQMNSDEFIDTDNILMSIIQVRNELEQVTNPDLKLNVSTALSQLGSLETLISSISTENGIDLSVENADQVMSILRAILSQLGYMDGYDAEIGVGADINEALTKMQIVMGQFSAVDGELAQLYVDLNTEEFYSDLSNVQNAVATIENRIANLGSSMDISNPDSISGAIQETIMLTKLLDSAETRMSSFDSGGGGGGGGENPRIKEIEQEKEAIQDRYDAEIEALRDKLDLMKEEEDTEERIKKLNEINDEITKTKNDKRFSYITKEGKEILTYNKEKVSELEKERDELIKQYEREDIKKSIEDEIERLEEAKDSKLEILEEELKNLREAQDRQSSARSSFTRTTSNQNSELRQKLQDHLAKLKLLYDEEVEKQEEKIEDVEENHENELDATETYKDGMENLHDGVVDDLNDKIDDMEDAWDDEIDLTDTKWTELIDEVEQGTIDFDTLMQGWYGDAITELQGFVGDLTTEINKVKSLYESLDNIEVTIPEVPEPQQPSQPSSGGGGTHDASDGFTGSGDYVDDSWSEPRHYEDEWDYEHGNDTSPPAWMDDDYLNSFHTGGIVGHSQNRANPDRVTKLINSLFNAKPNEEVVKALKNEIFVPQRNIRHNFIPNLDLLYNEINVDKNKQLDIILKEAQEKRERERQQRLREEQARREEIIRREQKSRSNRNSSTERVEQNNNSDLLNRHDEITDRIRNSRIGFNFKDMFKRNYQRYHNYGKIKNFRQQINRFLHQYRRKYRGINPDLFYNEITPQPSTVEQTLVDVLNNMNSMFKYNVPVPTGNMLSELVNSITNNDNKPNAIKNLQAMKQFMSTPYINKQNESLMQKIFHLKDITVRTDNAQSFIDSIDNLITALGN